jgi:hypothetical protein
MKHNLLVALAIIGAGALASCGGSVDTGSVSPSAVATVAAAAKPAGTAGAQAVGTVGAAAASAGTAIAPAVSTVVAGVSGSPAASASR